MAHKPGSRKEKVHEAFDKEGAEAATALGAELGLTPGTVRSWLNTWVKATGRSLPKTPKAPRTAEPAPRAPRNNSKHAGMVKIYHAGFPDMVAFVVDKGPQQSRVSWEDASTYGDPCLVANCWYRLVGTDEPLGCDCPNCKSGSTAKRLKSYLKTSKVETTRG